MNVNGTEGSHEVGEGDERPSVMNEIDVCCAECGEEEGVSLKTCKSWMLLSRLIHP